MAAGTVNGQVNASDIVISSQTLGTAAAFAVVMTANQYAAVDCLLYLTVPANHGGFKLNWVVPNRLDTGTWPLAKIREDWSYVDVGSDARPSIVPCVSINDSMHVDAAVILPPGSAARSLRINGSCLFKAPAGGGTVNLQGALAGSGANVTILANSQVEFRLY